MQATLLEQALLLERDHRDTHLLSRGFEPGSFSSSPLTTSTAEETFGHGGAFGLSGKLLVMYSKFCELLSPPGAPIEKGGPAASQTADTGPAVNSATSTMIDKKQTDLRVLLFVERRSHAYLVAAAVQLHPLFRSLGLVRTTLPLPFFSFSFYFLSLSCTAERFSWLLLLSAWWSFLLLCFSFHFEKGEDFYGPGDVFSFLPKLRLPALLQATAL